MQIVRWLIQIVLLITVVFFGYHYLTKSELQQCVTVPLASLNGKTEKINVDEEKVAAFMGKFGAGLEGIMENGEGLWEKFQTMNASESAKATDDGKEKSLKDELIDKGKYLYCKSVVEKVEEK